MGPWHLNCLYCYIKSIFISWTENSRGNLLSLERTSNTCIYWIAITDYQPCIYPQHQSQTWKMTDFLLCFSYLINFDQIFYFWAKDVNHWGWWYSWHSPVLQSTLSLEARGLSQGQNSLLKTHSPRWEIRFQSLWYSPVAWSICFNQQSVFGAISPTTRKHGSKSQGTLLTINS